MHPRLTSSRKLTSRGNSPPDHPNALPAQQARPQSLREERRGASYQPVSSVQCSVLELMTSMKPILTPFCERPKWSDTRHTVRRPVRGFLG